MSVGGEGRTQPATEGPAFGVRDFTGTTDPEPIFPVGTVTGSVLVQANPNNGDNIFIGWDDTVDATNGIIMEPGDTITIDIDTSDQNLFAVPANAADELRFLATN